MAGPDRRAPSRVRCGTGSADRDRRPAPEGLRKVVAPAISCMSSIDQPLGPLRSKRSRPPAGSARRLATTPSSARSPRSRSEPLLDAAGVRSGTRLLDVGTGPGYVAGRSGRARRRRNGYRHRAEAMVAIARPGWPGARFRQGDAHALPFPDGSFDAVTSGFAILHLGRPEQADSPRWCGSSSEAGAWPLTVWDQPPRMPLLGAVAAALASGRGSPCPTTSPLGRRSSAFPTTSVRRPAPPGRAGRRDRGDGALRLRGPRRRRGVERPHGRDRAHLGPRRAAARRDAAPRPHGVRRHLEAYRRGTSSSSRSRSSWAPASVPPTRRCWRRG